MSQSLTNREAPLHVADGSVEKCLRWLDTHDPENAKKAIHETDLLPDAYAAAILLEARHLYPSLTEPGKAEKPLEELLQHKLQQRPEGILDRETIAQQLAGELSLDMTENRFALLRRLLAGMPTATNKPLIQDDQVQLDRLAELLNRSGAEAELELRTGLYDGKGSPRPATSKLLERLPWLRPLIQGTVDTAKLHEASAKYHARQAAIRWSSLALAVVLLIGLALWAFTALTTSEKQPPPIFPPLPIEKPPATGDLTGGHRFAHFDKDGSVKAVVLMNDKKNGRYEAWVVDLRTGQKIAGPLSHRNEIYHAAFSLDGLRVVTASDDNTSMIWDADTGKQVAGPLNHLNAVIHATFNVDGRRVITASLDKTAVVWDAITGHKIAGPLIHGGTVNHASFGGDGKHVVTASHDGTAMVWDATTGQKIAGPLIHGGTVNHASFGGDGKHVVTASHDGTAMVWDATTGQKIAGPLNHKCHVLHAVYNVDATRVVTAAWDGTAIVWDAHTGKKIAGPLNHNDLLYQGGREGGLPDAPPNLQDLVYHAEFSVDGTRVVTAGENKAAVIWDAHTGQKIAGPFNHQARVKHAMFSIDAKCVVTLTAGLDNTVVLWDAVSGKKLGEVSVK